MNDPDPKLKALNKIFEEQGYRSLNQIKKDFLPEMEYQLLFKDQVKNRFTAICLVLSLIPSEDYEKLKRNFEGFSFYIPPDTRDGEVFSFKRILKGIIYLSPLLEREEEEKVRTEVAHELAHIMEEHYIGGNLKPNVIEMERKAWDLVAKWQFISRPISDEQFLKHAALESKKNGGEKN